MGTSNVRTATDTMTELSPALSGLSVQAEQVEKEAETEEVRRVLESLLAN